MSMRASSYSRYLSTKRVGGRPPMRHEYTNASTALFVYSCAYSWTDLDLLNLFDAILHIVSSTQRSR